jgi:hypothetical protein
MAPSSSVGCVDRCRSKHTASSITTSDFTKQERLEAKLNGLKETFADGTCSAG